MKGDKFKWPIVLFLVALIFSNTLPASYGNSSVGSTNCVAEVDIETDISASSYDAVNRECVYTFTYNSSARSITLPDNLYSLTITITGARGGQGGGRQNGSGVFTVSNKTSHVGTFTGTVLNPSRAVVTIHTGDFGSNGANGGSSTVAPTYPNFINGTKPGGAGGNSSYGANGADGGGSTGPSNNGNKPGGTGGGGGAATVVEIFGTPIFAAGGGGTGGTSRKSGDGNQVGGTQTSNSLINSATLSANTSGTNGTSGNGTITNTSCTATGGGGGGGGGGFIGGNGGSGSSPTCSQTEVATGGYPGLSGTTLAMVETSTSYSSVSTTDMTDTARGSAVIRIKFMGNSDPIFTIPSNYLIYRQASTIILSTTIAGRTTFRIKGKRIPGCISLRSNESNSFTIECIYRPSTRGVLNISVAFTPTDPSFSESYKFSETFYVLNRTSRR